jgi:hypothetical protein
MWRGAGRIVLWLVFLAVLVELASRVYLVVGLGASPVGLNHPLARYYPELGVVQATKVPAGDATLDVLLLGGSVLHPKWTPVAAVLNEWLTLETGREVRIHNLAGEGQTSRDSLIKYRRLGGHAFDLVVFYHGINEARANNAPPDVFDPAYAHYGWYRKVNGLDGDRWLPWLAAPAAVRHATRVVIEAVSGGPPVSDHVPPSAWLDYGGDVRSAESFRANLEAIARIARERREPLLLMTFALHVADGYTDRRFRERDLDYNRHLSPIGIWGRPENVVKAVEAHNDILRRAAVVLPGVLLVDQADRMPRGRIYFNDVCHLTVAGSEVFVANLMETALGAISGEGTEP